MGSDFIHYVLKYSAWNERGTEEFSSTEGELVVMDTWVELIDLSPGTTYAFTVKVCFCILSYYLNRGNGFKDCDNQGGK